MEKLAILLTIFLLGCDKMDNRPIKFKKTTIFNYSPKKTSFLADGQDSEEVVIYYNSRASGSAIKTKVEVKGGFIEEIGKTESEVKIEFDEIIDLYFSKFKVISDTSLDSLKMIINVSGISSEFNFPKKKSEAKNISLDVNAFSVSNGFLGEISFSASIRNGNGGKVSNGYKVKIVDLFKDKTLVGGRFRELSLTTGSESKVSGKYSPGLIEPNQDIQLVAYLEENQSISDTLLIHVISNN